MCFGNQQATPTVPTPQVLPPPPAPPPAPQAPPAPAQPLQTKKTTPGIKLKRSRAQASGAVSRGTNQLRIPVNIGTSRSGGLNL